MRPLSRLVLAALLLPTLPAFLSAEAASSWSSSSTSLSNSSTDVLTNADVLSNTVPDGFALVEAGSFRMGDSTETGLENEFPSHPVELTAYYIAKTELTQMEYAGIMGTNPSRFRGDHLPAEQVSWFDAVTYCNLRSVKEKLNPCYTVVTNPDTAEFGKWTVSCDFTANGYRLPTEAEWEFAARGGNRTRGFKYPGSWRAEDVAWFDTNALSSTHTVAGKATNELGLYDMAGNVWEWVWDWYAPYVEGYVKNPYGPYIGHIQPESEDSPVARTRRGGAWIDDAAPGDLGVRLTRRSPMEPDAFDGATGFRVVRTK